MNRFKSCDRKITQGFLNERYAISQKKGMAKQKWIVFCETMMAHGLELSLYEAKRTVSKYIRVKRPDDHSRSFRVRFSNHKPILHRETSGDCDFFVGRTNLGVRNTDDAIKATLEFFGIAQETVKLEFVPPEISRPENYVIDGTGIKQCVMYLTDEQIREMFPHE